MNDEFRAVLTEALGRHEFVPASFIADPKPAHCACGEWCDSGPGQARVRHNFLEHFADAILSLPGVAVIQLPEQGQGEFWRTLIGNEPEDVYPGPWGHIVISGTARLHSAEEARGLAAALLAAAAVVAAGEEA
ncbi:hypothetical protein SEA_TRIPL3T_83 [Mycobacterium phage Tripl3t]|nr:hypothetical protein SEA_TRIPL3T_83 [Mycobacterium phage Tripl3t]